HVKVEQGPDVKWEAALIGEVVHREDRTHGRQLRIERRGTAQEGRRERRLPVVQVQDVGWRFEPPEPLERGAAEEGEPLGVVGVLTARWPVERLAVEVAVGADGDRRDAGLRY